MSGNDRGRSVNLPNFWSFNLIDVKGLPLQFGCKTFPGLKLQIFKVEVAVFYSFYVEKFWRVQLSRSANLNLNLHINEHFEWELLWHLCLKELNVTYWGNQTQDKIFSPIACLYSKDFADKYVLLKSQGIKTINLFWRNLLKSLMIGDSRTVSWL